MSLQFTGQTSQVISQRSQGKGQGQQTRRNQIERGHASESQTISVAEKTQKEIDCGQKPAQTYYASTANQSLEDVQRAKLLLSFKVEDFYKQAMLLESILTYVHISTIQSITHPNTEKEKLI